MISVRGVAGRTARSCSGRCRTVARMWRPQGPVRRGLAPASQPLRPASRIIEHAPSDGSCRARASWSRRASLRPVTRLLALPLVLVAFVSANASAAELPFRSSVRPLPASLEADLAGGYWRPGCPVPLSQLRLLTVAHWGFDGGVRSGQLVVAREYADDLRGVFRKLYDLRFPIRHMRLSDSYGSAAARPADGDVSGSFECRQAVPSPCSGGSGTGSWSNHAYGRAIDLNPLENPYVGCGRTRDRERARYMDRSRLRRGMVTPAVVRAFRSIGWNWGGAWTGATKDYMHFSSTGH